MPSIEVINATEEGKQETKSELKTEIPIETVKDVQKNETAMSVANQKPRETGPK